MDAGGIAGDNYASISNCVSTGNVTDGATYTGGIAGDGLHGSLSDCGWLNYDGTLTNPTGNGGNTENVGAFTEDQLGLVVTSLTLSPNPVTVNGTAAVDFILAPANPAPDGAFGYFGAVRSGEVKYTLADDGIASASYSNGKITLTGKAVGETTMTVEVTLHTTDFSTLKDGTPGYVDEGSAMTFAVPVNVTAAASSGSGSSGSAGGGGGGGCNAGAGALALLALLPLFTLKRDK
ncbi:MAG TPA: SYNERG-CTERM sorting domain-containing protein [Candidatus Caccocola faecipullorum]|nr:SYNERG-CTERM sorting domain-containing protein [Candidatus Caccocola faecipullorum]